MASRSALRGLLTDGRLTQVPSVYDGLTARLAQAAGFEAVSVTGNGISASLLGKPDLGLVSLAETAAVARNLAAAVDIPLLFDADTGYGSAVNVTRTVQELETAGVAGIKLEDQVTPKRCRVLDTAVWARRDDELVIVARTDAASTLGVEAAAHRARAAVDAGADAAMVVGVRDRDALLRVAETVQAPLLVIVEERGPLAAMSAAEIEALGCSFAIYAGLVRYSVMGAVRRALSALRENGTTAAVRADMATADEWTELVGLPEYFALEQRFVRGTGAAAAGPDE